MASIPDECTEDSGWTTILCGSLSHDDDGGDGFSSLTDEDVENDYSGDIGFDDDDDDSSSLASDACSHVCRDLETLSHNQDSNSHSDIFVQDHTGDGAAAGGSWFGYNDKGGGYGGGGRNYSLSSEDKRCEKSDDTSVKQGQEKNVFSAKSGFSVKANASKGMLQGHNHGWVINPQFTEDISRPPIFQAFKN